MVAGLAVFYQRIPVGHVEAGLRTNDVDNPSPEEVNRRILSVVASYHFAPTGLAARNLRAEGIPADRIWITGNTVVDALLYMSRRIEGRPLDLDGPNAQCERLSALFSTDTRPRRTARPS